MIEIRAAFDLGSGATKVIVAEGTFLAASPKGTTGKQDATLHILYEVEVPLLLGLDARASRDGRLSDGIVTKLFDTVEKLVRQVRAVAVERGGPTAPMPRMKGVCTAVYRETVNGPAVLDALRERFQIDIRLLSQEEEGAIGFATGLHLAKQCDDRLGTPWGGTAGPSRSSPTDLVVWDSGGSSFQITQRNGISLAVMMGAWGSSKVHHEMIVTVQRKPKLGSANPVTLDQAEALCSFLVNDLTRNYGLPPVSADNRERTRVAAIGGPSCALRIATLVDKACVAGQPLRAAESGTNDEYTLADAERVLAACCNRSDAELRAAGIPEAGMAVPKLCLVVAVLRWCKGMERVRYFLTSGGGIGILLHPEWWALAGATSHL